MSHSVTPPAGPNWGRWYTQLDKGTARVAKPGHPSNIIRFGTFEVDLGCAELRRQGLRLRLQEQPFQVLAALLENPGEVVARDDLVRRLWPDGTVVDFDRGLNAAVTRLRQALSDSAETPRYVETVARRGYRFIAPVDSAAEPPPVTPVVAHHSSFNRPARILWAVVAMTVVGGATTWWTLSHRRVASSETPFRAVPLTKSDMNPVLPFRPTVIRSRSNGIKAMIFRTFTSSS